MMPPLTEPPYSDSDCAPYPNSLIALGGNRWLNRKGEVVTNTDQGTPVPITPRTRRWWEEAARRGGNELADLIV